MLRNYQLVEGLHICSYTQIQYFLEYDMIYNYNTHYRNKRLFNANNKYSEAKQQQGTI